MIVITLDMDWAPDLVIDWVADKLVEHNVKATWFVTHASPAVERLRQRSDLFELGIHPNFMIGSTHGNSPEEVLNHCLEVVPEATSMRSHGLAQSTDILAKVIETAKIKTDVSIYLPRMMDVKPVRYNWGGGHLVRMPFIWEDDFEIQKKDSEWELESLLGVDDGLRIFNFHPIHIFLNSDNNYCYEELKGRGLDAVGLSDEGRGFTHSGEGVGDFFDRCIQEVAKRGSYKIAELVNDIAG